LEIPAKVHKGCLCTHAQEEVKFKASKHDGHGQFMKHCGQEKCEKYGNGLAVVNPHTVFTTKKNMDK